MFAATSATGRFSGPPGTSGTPIDKTLGELRQEYGTAAFFHAKIRGHARTSYTGPMVCVACGYDLHVDVSHIKHVKDFPPEATLREVNDQKNLMALDKRCHWEYDHGYLALVNGQLLPVGR